MNHVSSQMCPINRLTSSNFIVLYGTNAFWGGFVLLQYHLQPLGKIGMKAEQQ